MPCDNCHPVTGCQCPETIEQMMDRVTKEMHEGPPEPKVVVGYIQPIKADLLKIDGSEHYTYEPKLDESEL